MSKTIAIDVYTYVNDVGYQRQFEEPIQFNVILVYYVLCINKYVNHNMWHG